VLSTQKVIAQVRQAALADSFSYPRLRIGGDATSASAVAVDTHYRPGSWSGPLEIRAPQSGHNALG
jgi:hypothetical protein